VQFTRFKQLAPSVVTLHARTSMWLKALCAASALILCLAVATTSRAQTFTIVATFDGTDGSGADAALVQGFDGNLYGVTSAGGSCKAASYGCGVVFKLTSNDTITALYDFCQQKDCLDGRYPNSLVQSTDGNFYGTTNIGGAGYGTDFKITPVGGLTSLNIFCGNENCPKGDHPQGLIQATDGNFYGTTIDGGGINCGDSEGCGTVYRMTGSGQVTILYRFCSQTNCSDGANPVGLILASNGNLYGVTMAGGVDNSLCEVSGGPPGCGTLFEITTSGILTTLYNFCSKSNCSDGALATSLIQAEDGYFYGTTAGGGLSNSSCWTFGCGTIFKISTAGVSTTLYAFCSRTNCADGAYPVEPMIQATDGDLYGTTVDGNGSGCHDGIHYCGTLFQVTSSGVLKTLHQFCSQPGCPDGDYSEAALTQATDGDFYGSAANKIFSLSVGLGPFVETIPTSGKVGTTINILGTNLTGATSVTFNGDSAVFTVVSSSQIKATVPTGAAPGLVKVTTPTGTLTSNDVFRVRP
jgi:uncharacterized repeat protein (TIGR03803 family)